MKNTVLIAAALLLFSLTTQAQVYENGKNYLNAGIGVGSFYRGLPIGFSYERGITDQISVGGLLDYSSTKYGYTGYDGKLTILFMGARASYHFNEILDVKNDKVDLYGGVALGFRSVKWKYENDLYDDLYDDPYSNGVLFGIHAGARYMFSDNLGGFTELGYGISILKLGLAVKF